MSGIVGLSDNVHLGGYPGPLRKMAGVWVEEIDALAPELSNEVVMITGDTCRCNLVCDLMHLEGAESLGSYGEDFYQGMPAVTKNSYGKGHVYYIGTHLEEQGLSGILDQASEDAGVERVVPDGDGLEIVCRRSQKGRIYFVLNFKDQEKHMPASLCGKQDLLSGENVTEKTVLKKYDVYILQE